MKVLVNLSRQMLSLCNAQSRTDWASGNAPDLHLARSYLRVIFLASVGTVISSADFVG